MAEAIARYDAADVIEASSAGLRPMGSIAEQTKETLILNGYSANGLTSDLFTREAAEAAEHHHQHDGHAKEIFWEQEKSRTGSCRIRYGSAAETYQRVFEGIKRRIDQLALGLKRKAREQTRGKNRSCIAARKTSVSQEDYLKAIWEMLEEDQMPISARLAERIESNSSSGDCCIEAHDARRPRARGTQRTDRPDAKRAANMRNISR